MTVTREFSLFQQDFFHGIIQIFISNQDFWNKNIQSYSKIVLMKSHGIFMKRSLKFIALKNSGYKWTLSRKLRNILTWLIKFQNFNRTSDITIQVIFVFFAKCIFGISKSLMAVWALPHMGIATLFACYNDVHNFILLRPTARIYLMNTFLPLSFLTIKILRNMKFPLQLMWIVHLFLHVSNMWSWWWGRYCNDDAWPKKHYV